MYKYFVIDRMYQQVFVIQFSNAIFGGCTDNVLQIQMSNLFSMVYSNVTTNVADFDHGGECFQAG